MGKLKERVDLYRAWRALAGRREMWNAVWVDVKACLRRIAAKLI